MDLNIIRINHDDGQWKETIDTHWKRRCKTARESKVWWQSRFIVNKCNLITWQLATTTA